MESRRPLRRSLLLFAAALALRLIYTFVIVDYTGWLPVIQEQRHQPVGDGGLYHQYALSLSEQGFYGLPVITLDEIKGLSTKDHYKGHSVGTIRKRIEQGLDSYLMEPGQPTNFNEPSYAVFLTLFYKSVGQNFILIQIVQAILDSLAAVVIYLWGRRLFKDGVALTGAGLYAAYPWAWECSRAIQSEALVIPLLIISMYFIQRTISEKPLWTAAAAGLFLGLAYQARVISMVLMAVGLLWLVLFHKPRFLMKAGLIIGLFILTISPWVIRNKVTFNAWWFISTKSSANMWVVPDWYRDNGKVQTIGRRFHLYDHINHIELMDEPRVQGIKTEKERYEYLMQRGRRFYAANPGFIASIAIHQMGRVLKPRLDHHGPIFFIAYILLWIFGLIGLWVSRRQFKEIGWLAIFIALYTAGVGLTLYDDPRMQWPFNPVLAVLGGVGVGFVFETVRRLVFRKG
jgi:4-amino-4-deoxy-L-arabinose transferase-like glycosyltransferase